MEIPLRSLRSLRQNAVFSREYIGDTPNIIALIMDQTNKSEKIRVSRARIFSLML
ncbi:hypothetical protein BH10CHL1_BH10CHL1_02560 [soil metagenome]